MSESVINLHNYKASKSNRQLFPGALSSALPKFRAGLLSAAIVAFLLYSFGAKAATITWTNLAGGSWSSPSNWNPNQIPGGTNRAAITVQGSYTIVLDADTTIGSLTLGGTGGVQTLTNSSSALT